MMKIEAKTLSGYKFIYTYIMHTNNEAPILSSPTTLKKNIREKKVTDESYIYNLTKLIKLHVK